MQCCQLKVESARSLACLTLTQLTWRHTCFRTSMSDSSGPVPSRPSISSICKGSRAKWLPENASQPRFGRAAHCVLVAMRSRHLGLQEARSTGEHRHPEAGSCRFLLPAWLHTSQPRCCARVLLLRQRLALQPPLLLPHCRGVLGLRHCYCAAASCCLRGPPRTRQLRRVHHQRRQRVEDASRQLPTCRRSAHCQPCVACQDAVAHLLQEHSPGQGAQCAHSSGLKTAATPADWPSVSLGRCTRLLPVGCWTPAKSAPVAWLRRRQEQLRRQAAGRQQRRPRVHVLAPLLHRRQRARDHEHVVGVALLHEAWRQTQRYM